MPSKGKKFNPENMDLIQFEFYRNTEVFVKCQASFLSLGRAITIKEKAEEKGKSEPPKGIGRKW